MDVQPRGYDKALELIGRGVDVPNPLALDIGDEVDIRRISRHGVTLLPGCRVYGSGTVISAGCTIGTEGPVTLDDCRLGPGVRLKGGSFVRSVLLEKASVGPCAQVREACLLEEEVSAAHCVGLKQTILFPFVTLGSLINFCDCLMAGGTSRSDHSEVGSSYVHFNYTPDGDKTTASLFGDVAHGVMLDQPPIFLGGQGGAVGPVRVGYGAVVAAGSVLRHDVGAGKLVVEMPPSSHEREHVRHAYRNLQRVLARNIAYLANIEALRLWYTTVRRPFFERQELGVLVYEGALDVLSSARLERMKRLGEMTEKVDAATPVAGEFRARSDELAAVFTEPAGLPDGRDFVEALEDALGSGNYLETVRGMSAEQKALGVHWLEQVVSTLCDRAAKLLPSLDLSDPHC